MKMKQILGTALVAASLVGFSAPILANASGATTGCPSTACCPCVLSVSHQSIDHGNCGNGKCNGKCKGKKKGNSKKSS